MYWYDFDRYEVYAGTSGDFRRSNCITVSKEEKQKIAEFFFHPFVKNLF